ncbi:MAG: site-specific DNA-methyltransferase [Bacteroidaceae bacterium]|nr:site-specific DNA-methyltransferase [Bacteroidaceae bacterium]
MLIPYFQSSNNLFTLYHGDTLNLLKHLDGTFDMVFADPPYFLSTGNTFTNRDGQTIKFDKGEWDRVRSRKDKDIFNKEWLSLCVRLLKRNGTIWVCGTYHNIFSIEKCLHELGFRIINVIVWQKADPPITISDRRFSFCAEYIIWAARKDCYDYTFNYEEMLKINEGKQMPDVWKIPAASSWEKSCGKHPTQKPLRLLYRVVLSSTNIGDRILDPFTGSSTTGIAANLLERTFVGIDESEVFLNLSIKRCRLIEDKNHFLAIKQKMEEELDQIMVLVNHARSELKEQMIRTGICYIRIGDSKGSVLVTHGFERMQYVLLHTNGDDCHLYRLCKKGCFNIWSKETLEKYGFHPEHSPYYAVFLFDHRKEIEFPKTPNLKQKINTYRSKIRPLEDFFEF